MRLTKHFLTIPCLLVAFYHPATAQPGNSVKRIATPKRTVFKPVLVLQATRSGQLRSLAISPDGKQLVSATEAGSIQLWDSATGELQRVLYCPGVKSVAVSPNGKFLAAGAEDQARGARGGAVALWERTSWKQVWRKGTAGRVSQVVFSPDSNVVAAGVAGNEAHIDQFRTVNGAFVRSSFAGGLEADAFTYLRDGKTLVAGTYPTQSPDPFMITISRDGWVEGTDYDIVFLNASPGHNPVARQIIRGQKPHGSLDGDPINCIVVSPDGKYIATGHGPNRGAVKLWDVAKRRYIRTFCSWNSGYHEVHSVAFSPDGTLLASGGMPSPEGKIDGGYVAIWDVKTGKLLRRMAKGKGFASRLVFGRDNRTLFVAALDGTMEAWDAKSGWRKRGIGRFMAPADKLAVSTNGKDWASSRRTHAYVWNFGEAEPLRILAPERNIIEDMTIAPGRNTLALATGDETSGEVTLRDYAGKSVGLSPIKAGNAVRAVRYSRDGSILAVGDAFGKIQIWDMGSGAKEPVTFAALQGPASWLSAMALSPDGRTLAIAGMDDIGEKRTLEIWDVSATPILKRKSEGNTNVRGGVNEYLYAMTMDFAPDNVTLAIGNLFGSIYIVNSTTGKTTKSWKVPGIVISSLKYAADGKTLLGGGGDGRLLLWEVATGKRLWGAAGVGTGNPNGHGAWINTAIFSGDGKKVLSASEDATIKCWDAQTGRLQATLVVLPPHKDKAGSYMASWIAYTPEGYYDGSSDIASLIRWRKNNKLWPATQFETQFHKPERIKKALGDF